MTPPRITLGPVRAALVAALAGVLAVTIAGCGGSSIDPETAGRANAAVRGLSNGQGAGNPTGEQTSSVPGDQPTVPGGSSTTSTDPNAPNAPGNQPSSNTGNGNDPPAAIAGASCAGFKNGHGITDDVIRIGNSSDISGPVPGLFTAAQQATRAYVQYFNDSGARICGRRLQLDLYDSRTDSGGDQQGYLKGCSADFAMVGSMSAFDSGGAGAAENCGLPDIRAIATTVDRGNCKTCFSAQPAGPDAFENAVPDFIIRHTGGKKAAAFYINAGASADNGKSQVRHETKRGVKYVVTSGIDVAEFNYSPYVQKLKSAGATSVQFIAASPQFARMAQAFVNNNYKPKLFLLDPSAYNDDYIKAAGSAAKGTVVFLNFVPFEEASTNQEVKLYLQYLQQVAPGAKPTFFGLFAWSAARLFAEQASKLGGKLNRASLISSMRSVDNWTANGMHAPQHVGSKKIADCWRFIQWNGSKWVPVEGRSYQCRGTTS